MPDFFITFISFVFISCIFVWSFQKWDFKASNFSGETSRSMLMVDISSFKVPFLVPICMGSSKIHFFSCSTKRTKQNKHLFSEEEKNRSQKHSKEIEELRMGRKLQWNYFSRIKYEMLNECWTSGRHWEKICKITKQNDKFIFYPLLNLN